MFEQLVTMYKKMILMIMIDGFCREDDSDVDGRDIEVGAKYNAMDMKIIYCSSFSFFL